MFHILDHCVLLLGKKMFLNNKMLAKVALAGGVIALGSATFFNWKIQSNLKKSDYFQTAVKILAESKVAAAALGPPILIGTIDLGDNRNNWCDGLQAAFRVPVKGSKTCGTLVFTASRDTYNHQWQINQLELLDKEATKKLTLVPVLESSSQDDH